MDHILQFVLGRQSEDHMNVIRHHHEGFELVAITVEMAQSVRDDSRESGVLENALTASSIQPGVNGLREKLMIFTLCHGIPGLGMTREPRIPLGSPLVELFLRQAVSQTPGGEYQFALLLPMREVKGDVLLDFLFGVEIRRRSGRDAHAP